MRNKVQIAIVKKLTKENALVAQLDRASAF